MTTFTNVTKLKFSNLKPNLLKRSKYELCKTINMFTVFLDIYILLQDDCS